MKKRFDLLRSVIRESLLVEAGKVAPGQVRRWLSTHRRSYLVVLRRAADNNWLVYQTEPDGKSTSQYLVPNKELVKDSGPLPVVVPMDVDLKDLDTCQTELEKLKKQLHGAGEDAN